jgi:hypothetical protein
MMLYRAVSDDEMYDVRAVRAFRTHPAYPGMLGKCFTVSIDCAVAFGQALMIGEDHLPYHVVEVEVHDSWRLHMRFNANQDQICPSYTLDWSMLEKFNNNILSLEMIAASIGRRDW